MPAHAPERLSVGRWRTKRRRGARRASQPEAVGNRKPGASCDRCGRYAIKHLQPLVDHPIAIRSLLCDSPGHSVASRNDAAGSGTAMRRGSRSTLSARGDRRPANSLHGKVPRVHGPSTPLNACSPIENTAWCVEKADFVSCSSSRSGPLPVLGLDGRVEFIHSATSPTIVYRSVAARGCPPRSTPSLAGPPRHAPPARRARFRPGLVCAHRRRVARRGVRQRHRHQNPRA